MGIVTDATIAGYNEYIQELQKDTTNELEFTLTKFNTAAHTVFIKQPLKEVPELNHTRYCPSGGTALYDAISYAIRNVENGVRTTDKALVVILTDGHENSSRETTKEQISNLISAKEELGNWTFAYLGANQDAWDSAQAIGITTRGSTRSYDHSHIGTVSNFAGMAASTNALRVSKNLQDDEFTSSPTYDSAVEEAVKREENKS